MSHPLDITISGKWERIPGWFNCSINFIQKEVIIR